MTAPVVEPIKRAPGCICPVEDEKLPGCWVYSAGCRVHFTSAVRERPVSE